MKRMLIITALMISIPLFLRTPRVRAEEPAPGVGRVSLIHGDVSTMRGDSGDWVATTVNAPLVQGDKIATGQGSRAEVQLDYANILRLDQSTEAKIADLTRGRLQIQVASGLVNLTVLKGTEADVEIDTPNMAVHPRGEGIYRIQVNSPSDTAVTVRRGEAEVSTQQGSATVQDGQMIYVKGSDNAEYRVAQAAGKDEWDQWNRERDRTIEEAASYRYTNHRYTGAQDLDRYGRWVNVPDYGYAWTPDVGPDWVPYSDGRWVWEPYYGWTWVSYEPWGWAPYHYGRWFWWNNAWAWWPGAVGPGFFPTWGPAWVSFLGFGFGGRNWGFGFGFGFGSIGWCPLGPFDPFFPWWGFGNSFTVVNITNITNVTNVNNVFNHTLTGRHGRVFGSNLQGALTNSHIRRAITTVSAGNFAAGHMPRNRTLMDVNTLRQASVVKGTLPVAPTRQSLQPIDRPVNRAALPKAGTERFFSNRQAPAGPRPFTEHAAQIQQMMQTHNSLTTGNAAAGGTGRPAEAGRVGIGGMNGLTAGAGGATRVMPARPFGAGQATATQTNPAQGAPQAQSGEPPRWQRFGTPRHPAPGTPIDRFQRANPSPSRWPAAVNTPGPRPQPAPNQAPEAIRPRPVPSNQPGEQGGWRRFSSQPAPYRTVPGPAPRTGGGPAPAAPRSEAAAPGWNRFEPRPAGNPAERSGGWNAPAPRERSYPSRPEGRSWGGAPRGGYERPPLQLRKPITTERSYTPRSYGGGGGRSYSAPSGGGRGYSAPSGGGRSAPAPRGGGGGGSGSRRH